MFDRQITSITVTLWCLRRRSYLTCSYALDTPAGVVLIDAGMDSTAGDVDALLDAMKKPRNAVRAILLTHWHNDHAAGAAVITQRTGCPVFHHAADSPWLTGVTAHRGLRGFLAGRLPEWGLFVLLVGLLGEAIPRPIVGGTLVGDGDVIADEFEVIATPGHTPGHISFFHRPTRTLFAGDALAVIGNQIRLMARPVTLDRAAARRSMLRVLDLDIHTLCPGHRHVLTQNVALRCAEARERLTANDHWPLLG
jgi:glyoxylase-like metal-dependent hydrolase (beta-lactamase superfamily II)